MKKYILIITFCLIGSQTIGQSFNLGVNIGIPTGDAEDFYTFVTGADVNYLWEVSDNFDAGIASGFDIYFGEDTDFFEVDNSTLVPIAVAGRLALSDGFTLGADLGYGFFLDDDSDGGFYYRPLLGYDVGEKSQLTASYRAVTKDGFTFSGLTLGFIFSL